MKPLAALRRRVLRTRATACVHGDRIESLVDGTADHACRVITLYRASFPSAFGPMQGRMAGERAKES